MGNFAFTRPVGVLIVAFAALSAFGQASTFYVSTNGLHDVSGVTWGTYRTDDGVDHDAYTNLQEALTYACNNNAGSTIWVENGYVLDTGATTAGGIDNRLTFSGWDCRITVRSRSGDWRTGAEIRGDDHTRCIFGTGSSHMYGMRIVGGTCTNGNGGGVIGGTYTITLHNCLLADCCATNGNGGAGFRIHCHGCTITNCSVSSGSGGGLYQRNAYDCTFDHCSAIGTGWSNGNGGGSCEQSVVSNCVFTDCSAYNKSCIDHASGQAGVGGAVCGIININSGSTAFWDCWVTNCTASAAGGAISHVRLGDHLTAVGCSAGRGGGGVSGGCWTNLTIIGCVQTNTVTSSGGGATGITACDVLISNCVSYAYGGGAGVSTLTNAIIVCNVATNTTKSGYPAGGGLYKGTAVHSLVASNSTICSLSNRGTATYASGGGTSGTALISSVVSNNTAWGRGGGVSGGSMANCIVANNHTYADGGGVAGSSSILGTLICGNVAEGFQGGVFNYNNKMVMVNCTVACNTNSYNRSSVSTPTAVTNCVVWGNTAATQLSATAVSHSCYPEAAADNANGNVSADPNFGVREGKPYCARASRCRGGGAVLDAMTNSTGVLYSDCYGDARLKRERPDMGWVSVPQNRGLLLFAR